MKRHKHITTILLISVFITAYNMKKDYLFPFGSKLTPVKQTDTTAKKIFVLGVYASAVHAQWLDKDNKIKIRAMAVASEPYIFWHGNHEEAANIISKINIPTELGKLIPADSLNGPSGKALDEYYLFPLGYTRSDAWLCDLLPYACINPSQEKALEREYNPLKAKYNLNDVTITTTPTNFANDDRMKEILFELKQSKAKNIILLGDQPIKYLLPKYSNCNKKSLAEFGKNENDYGKWHEIIIDGEKYKVLPLVHPRQAASLGISSAEWTTLHKNWLNNIKNK